MSPSLGIIMLDTTFPRIKGDIGNPDSFTFPVLYETVTGASPARVVKEADETLLSPFIKAAEALVARGASAITTSCGFLAVWQQELSRSVAVPVFTSSLLQVHLAQALLKPRQMVGILTASREHLTERHLAGVGIDRYPCAIVGMEEGGEFASVFLQGKGELDVEKCRREMVARALDLVHSFPEVGAIVLECTNMPPYAADVRRATGLPVFDALTLTNFIYRTLP